MNSAGQTISGRLAAARTVHLRVPPSCAGMRLDKALATLLDVRTRQAVRQMVKDGHVKVGGATCGKAHRTVAEGEEISVCAAAAPAPAANPGDLPEDVEFGEAYADDDLIVVDKPAGLVVHPARGNRTGTLLNGLLARHPELARLPRAGIVHRLDRGTSGLLVVARTAHALDSLAKQFRGRLVTKEYLVIVHGSPPGTGRIEMPIARDRSNRLRMAVHPRGREAITAYRVRERFPRHALLEMRISTGRTHQIRVHLEASGYPVLGDPRYTRHVRDSAPRMPRQALHAWRLSLSHPATGRTVGWSSEMPRDMREAVDALRKNA